jgi:putative Holliday junction resolvase
VSRILAVDWGTRRVGVAVSDPSGLVARPLPTLKVKSARDAREQVERAARSEEAEVVVIGLPLNMDGTEGASAARARSLGAALEAQGFAVRFLDERLTTDDARRWLRERGEARPDLGRVDQVAALLLLQEFLAESGRNGHA